MPFPLSTLLASPHRLFSPAWKLTVIPFPLCVFSQGKLTKLNHEHRDLKEKLKEERKQIEELWKTKTELEDVRRLQDRTVEQLQRKVRGGPGLFIGPKATFGAK